MSSPFSQLLGDTLTSAAGPVATKTALDGKEVVGLYFSAHWCGPCRGFTPKLASSYTKDLQGKKMEIVFVSSDRDEGSFGEYFKEMPWLSLPFAERDIKNKLSKKYKVQGIPCFVILDGATGELITKDGRSMVTSDPKGEKLPWKPPTVWEALGDEFLSSDGETVSLDEIQGEGKYIGLYFSAHWCGPCRGFTPQLVESYEKHLKAKGLQIIFVSSDRDTTSFSSYFSEMPWLAIPNGDPRKEVLSRMFDVEGIPTFVVIDAKTGKTINADARGAVGADLTGAEFPWHPKPLNDLESKAEGINEEVSLCVLMEGCDAATKESATACLTTLAEASKAANEEICFFYAKASSGVVPQIRNLCKLADSTTSPTMILLDIPDNGGFYVSPATEITGETVRAFIDAYKAGALERRQLG